MLWGNRRRQTPRMDVQAGHSNTKNRKSPKAAGLLYVFLNPETALSRLELRAGLSLAAVFFLRMLALFMVLPVIALAAGTVPGATPLTIGLALGIYGLTQALLQIPLGILSDHWGRKPVILFGLVLFTAGCLLLAWANSILMLIAGRALQGCGAIAAPLMALAADLGRESRYPKIMACIGLGVGAAFVLALLLGPGLYALLGLSRLLLLCAGLAVLAIGVLFAAAPPAPPLDAESRRHGLDSRMMRTLVTAPGLLQASLGIFLSHLLLTANFTVLPLLLRDALALPAAAHWQFYLPMLLVSLIGALLLIFYCRWSGRGAVQIPLCILACLLAQLGLGLSAHNWWTVFLLVTLFFTAFHCLEAYLPAQAAGAAPARRRGAALGVYNTAQFLGLFCGGVFGGVLHDQAGQREMFLGCAALAVLWWRLARRPARPLPGAG